MSSNWLLIIFPIILFIFKNLFPVLCELVFSDKNLSGFKSKIIEELLLFPVDLLFIAISYTAPKIIDVINTLSKLKLDNAIERNIANYSLLINYCVRCFIMLILLPIIIILTKFSIKLADKGENKKQQLLTFLLYALSIVAVIYSLFLYK